jgi:DNA repair protein RadC
MTSEHSIKSIPKSERPYEKCIACGPGVLTDTELLAVIIRSGTPGNNSLQLSSQILELTQATPYRGLAGLQHLTIRDFMSVYGIGEVKAVQLTCIGELSRRISTQAAKKQLCFTDPGSIADYMMEKLRHEEQEHVIALYLDSKNALISEQLISIGTVNTASVTPREVLVQALKWHAAHFILLHNHPSGDPTPSSADYLFTQNVCQAGQITGIPLLDHIIIGDRCYYSFLKEGLMAQIEEAQDSVTHSF